MKKMVLFLVGPTAVGKTQTALTLARRLEAEIISLDSMQIYTRMNIVTCKPPLKARGGIPHHLIGRVSPEKEYNAYKYYKDALRLIGRIHKRNKVPLFVGGTGLYMSVLRDGIFKEKTENSRIRKKLSAVALLRGSQWLYARLKEVDPGAAQKIHPNDVRRIVRALEVFESTGKPISALQAQKESLDEKHRVFVFCLTRERSNLYGRIDERVARMFNDGLVKEIKGLKGLRLSKTARSAIGLKEIGGYLKGLYSLDEAKAMMQRNTRLYAKRQLTWFRKDKRIIWIELGREEKPSHTADSIAAIIGKRLKEYA